MNNRVFCPLLAPEGAPSPLEFPAELPIKVIGNADDRLAGDVLAAVRALQPGFAATTLTTRPSGQGHYLALTLRVTLASRADWDTLMAALRAVPQVRMAF